MSHLHLTRYGPSPGVLWDQTVSFMVEGQLSKVPAHRFMEESEYFTSHFIAGNPPDALVAIHSVTANGFRTLLELLYPRLSNSATIQFTRYQWLDILYLSTTWRFDNFRQLAIDQLSSLIDNAIDLIIIGRQAFVPEWVTSGYNTLVCKREPISEEESQRIGPNLANRLWLIRYRLMDQNEGEGRQRASISSPYNTPLPLDPKALELIERDFEDELSILGAHAGGRISMGPAHHAQEDEPSPPVHQSHRFESVDGQDDDDDDDIDVGVLGDSEDAHDSPLGLGSPFVLRESGSGRRALSLQTRRPAAVHGLFDMEPLESHELFELSLRPGEGLEDSGSSGEDRKTFVGSDRTESDEDLFTTPLRGLDVLKRLPRADEVEYKNRLADEEGQRQLIEEEEEERRVDASRRLVEMRAIELQREEQRRRLLRATESPPRKHRVTRQRSDRRFFESLRHSESFGG